MSEWKIAYSQQAERDLDAICRYIAGTLLVPDTAKKQVRRIADAIDELNHMPLRHRLCEYEPWHSRGLRQLQADNYLVFYLPVELKKVVFIIRVMYGGRDISEALRETTIE
ncbi:MAG: type II toxin-antitoxin system RelE/ParE family toxin [Oscillospiraceae bacterium]|jgi:toxin ParE1/3/4|nr:type II toxin-antitoxin system RelE/ParE family toxin [Oscillospiraceae bacterium]